MVNIWIQLLAIFLLAAAITVPSIIIWWLKKEKKINDNIPDKLKQEVIKNAESKELEREGWEEYYRRTDIEGTGVNRREPDIERRPDNNGSEGETKEVGGVPIPSDNYADRNQRESKEDWPSFS